jgi:uncharacterized protein YjiS (DUF1127 family)
MTTREIVTTMFQSIKNLAEALREARAAHDVYFNLSSMSDEGLRSHGIKRHEIASIALKQIRTGAQR